LDKKNIVLVEKMEGDVRMEYQRESETFLVISGVALAISIVNCLVMHFASFQVTELDKKLGGIGTLFLNFVILIFAVDPTAKLRRYPEWFPKTWIYVMVAFFLGFLTVLFDRTLRVLLKSKNMPNVLPAERYTLATPLVGLGICSLISAILVGNTNNGKYAAIVGFYSGIMLYSAGAVLFWTAYIVRKVTSKASSGNGLRAHSNRRTVIARLLLAGGIVGLMGTLVLFLTIRLIATDAEDPVQDNTYKPTTALLPFTISTCIITITNSFSIFQAKKGAGAPKQETNKHSSHRSSEGAPVPSSPTAVQAQTKIEPVPVEDKKGSH
jgi:hypothetical protein